MTEPERKKWQQGERWLDRHLTVWEGDRRVGEFSTDADAARIVALNNAEGGQVEWRVSEEMLTEDWLSSYDENNRLAKHIADLSRDLRDARAALAVQAQERTKAEIVADVSTRYPVIDATLKRSEDECPAFPVPATPVIDKTRRLVAQWDDNEMASVSWIEAESILRSGALLARLRSILAEHDAVRERAEGRKR